MPFLALTEGSTENKTKADANGDTDRGVVENLDTNILGKGDVTPNASGRQEFLENLINEYI